MLLPKPPCCCLVVPPGLKLKLLIFRENSIPLKHRPIDRRLSNIRYCNGECTNIGMEASPFHKLPRELRDDICTRALLVQKQAGRKRHESKEVRIEPLGMKFRCRRVCRHPLALTEACKQIRQESLTLFYRINTFRFETLDTLRDWKDQVSRECSSSLCYVKISLRDLDLRLSMNPKPLEEAPVVQKVIETIKDGHSKDTSWYLSFCIMHAKNWPSRA